MVFNVISVLSWFHQKHARIAIILIILWYGFVYVDDDYLSSASLAILLLLVKWPDAHFACWSLHTGRMMPKSRCCRKAAAAVAEKTTTRNKRSNICLSFSCFCFKCALILKGTDAYRKSISTS